MQHGKAYDTPVMVALKNLLLVIPDLFPELELFFWLVELVSLSLQHTHCVGTNPEKIDEGLNCRMCVVESLRC